MQAYVANDSDFLSEALALGLLDHMPEQQRHFADLLSRTVFEFYTHKYIYDYENFSALLFDVGFQKIKAVEFQPEIDNPEPLRRKYSFYLEASKD